MKLDENKVNLQEKDIETYLYTHPTILHFSHGRIERWIKRQFEVPSGIIDLVGVTTGGNLAIVEIKNVAIDASALTQVCRYAHDLENVVGLVAGCFLADGCPWPEIHKFVVGRSIDTKTMREAEALRVLVFCFDVELHLQIPGTTSWTQEFKDHREKQYEELCADEDIVAALEQYNQNFLEYERGSTTNDCTDSSVDAIASELLEGIEQ